MSKSLWDEAQSSSSEALRRLKVFEKFTRHIGFIGTIAGTIPIAIGGFLRGGSYDAYQPVVEFIFWGGVVIFIFVSSILFYFSYSTNSHKNETSLLVEWNSK